MNSHNRSVAAVVDLAESFALDGDAGAFRAQLAQMTLDGLDIADLLDHLDHIKGDPDRKAQAIVAVRAKLGLPVVPGPVCRPRPLR
jgi:hypothetical protein